MIKCWCFALHPITLLHCIQSSYPSPNTRMSLQLIFLGCAGGNIFKPFRLLPPTSQQQRFRTCWSDTHRFPVICCIRCASVLPAVSFSILNGSSFQPTRSLIMEYPLMSMPSNYMKIYSHSTSPRFLGSILQHMETSIFLIENVGCEYDRLNSSTSTFQAAWYIYVSPI